jgi:hypothetical protein
MTSLTPGAKNSFDNPEEWMKIAASLKGLISDFYGQYLIKINSNDSPYDVQIKKYNNNVVQKWHDLCLQPHADKFKKITSQEATDRWYSFHEGRETRKAEKHKDLQFHPTQKQSELWVRIFEKCSPVEIVKYGKKPVHGGYIILTNAWDDWFVQAKFTECFSKKDPDEWYKKFKEGILLFKQIRRPFELDNIRDKLRAILAPQNNVLIDSQMKGIESLDPEKFYDYFHVKISENEKPYDLEIKEYNNSMLKTFSETCLPKGIDMKEAIERYNCFLEGHHIRLAMKYWNIDFHPDQTMVDTWVAVVLNASPAELMRYGMRTLRDGYCIITAKLEDIVTKHKYGKCFTGSDPVEWYDLCKKYEVLSEEELPFNINLINEKLLAVFKHENQPGPKKDFGINRM